MARLDVPADASTGVDGAPVDRCPALPSPVLQRLWLPAQLLVAVVAFFARLVPMLRGGGLAGNGMYDDSVYYSAAAALVHGRAPYDQFVLLHPPGLILALTPFAALARVTSDTIGQDVARLAFMAIGSLKAVLVLRLGSRFSPVAGLVAGVLYALSFPAMQSERTTTLETLGTLAILVALVLLMRPGHYRDVRPWSSSRLVCSGAALGAGAGVKIWGVVPFVVLLVWVLISGGWRAAGRLAAGAVVAVTAICLPFFLQAPIEMTRYVLLDQLGRPGNGPSLIGRVIAMTGLEAVLPHGTATQIDSALAVILAVLAASSVIVLQMPGARVLVPLLLAQAAVLLESPSSYLHYATLTAVPATLILGLAAGQIHRWTSGRLAGPLRFAAVALLLTGIVAYAEPGVRRPDGGAFPPALIAAAAREPGCITADDPGYLISMNVLSRDLDHGCRVWIDVTGLSYDPAGGRVNGQPLHLSVNAEWQHKVMGYLLSGSAVIVDRKETHLSASSTRRISTLPALAHVHAYVLHKVR